MPQSDVHTPQTTPDNSEVERATTVEAAELLEPAPVFKLLPKRSSEARTPGETPGGEGEFAGKPFGEVKETFPVGSAVTLRGLEREHYNDRAAVVIGHDDLSRRVNIGVQSKTRSGETGRKKMKVDAKYLELQSRGEGEISAQTRDEIEMYTIGGTTREHSMMYEAGDAKEPSAIIQVEDDDSEQKQKRDLGRCPNATLAILEWQLRLRIWYGQSTIQWGVTILILINFVFILLQNSYPFLGQGNVLSAREIALFETIMNVTDWFFLTVFTLELGVNFFAHWFVEFWRDGWNIFDFIIITGSWALKFTSIPASAIRVIRALRVTRLIGKLTALRIIVNTLTASIPAMGFLTTMLCFLIAIFATVCINMFKDITPARCAAIAEDKQYAEGPYWACKSQDVNANQLSFDTVDDQGANVTIEGAAVYAQLLTALQAGEPADFEGKWEGVVVKWNNEKRLVTGLNQNNMVELDLEGHVADNGATCRGIEQEACYEFGDVSIVDPGSLASYSRPYWETMSKMNKKLCAEAGLTWRKGQICTVKDRFVEIIASDDWGGVNRFSNFGQSYFSLLTMMTFEAFPGYINQVHQYGHGFAPGATIWFVIYLIMAGIIFMEFYQTILLDKMMEAKEFVKIRDRLDKELLKDRKLQIKRHITRVHRVRLDTLHPYNASHEPLREKDDPKLLRKKLDKIGKEYHTRLPAVGDLKKAKRWDDRHVIPYEHPDSRYRAMCELQTRRGATEEEDSLSIPPEEVVDFDQTITDGKRSKDHLNLLENPVSVEMPEIELGMEGSVSVQPAEAEEVRRRAAAAKDPPSYKALAAASLSKKVSRANFLEFVKRMKGQFDAVGAVLDNMEGKKYGGSAFSRAG